MESVIKKALATDESFSTFIKNIQENPKYCLQFLETSIQNNFKYNEVQLEMILQILVQEELLEIYTSFLVPYLYKKPDITILSIYKGIIYNIVKNQQQDLAAYFQLFVTFSENILNFSKYIALSITPIFKFIMHLEISENQCFDQFFIFLFQLEEQFKGFKINLIEEMIKILVLLDLQASIQTEKQQFNFHTQLLSEDDVCASVKAFSVSNIQINLNQSDIQFSNSQYETYIKNSTIRIDSLLFVLFNVLSNQSEEFLTQQFLQMFMNYILPIQNLNYAPFLIFPLLQNENIQNAIIQEFLKIAFANPQTPINMVVLAVEYITGLLSHSTSVQPKFVEQILVVLIQIASELLLVNPGRLSSKFDLNSPGGQRAILCIRSFTKIFLYNWKSINIDLKQITQIFNSQIFSFIGTYISTFRLLLVNIGGFNEDIMRELQQQDLNQYKSDLTEIDLFKPISLQKSDEFISDTYKNEIDFYED